MISLPVSNEGGMGKSSNVSDGEQSGTTMTIPPSNLMRLFRIHRLRDGKNISGTGKVIDGVQFENGQVVVCWKTRYSSLGIFKSMDDFVQVHAKPFFKENEFEWIEGYKPDQELNAVLDELIDYIMRQNIGIKDKAKGNIISKIYALRYHNQRAVDPIVFNKRTGQRPNATTKVIT